MHNLINAYPLYNFLRYCNNSSLDKIILDCGAGGANPPLSLFNEFGYDTYGIEISEEQIEKVSVFNKIQGLDLEVVKGDMRNIPFKNEDFSFLYSYNTSVHMRKEDFGKALLEFYRVLKNGGLCYVNFLSEDCDTFGVGVQLSEGEFKQNQDGEEVLYCHYKEKEIEQKLIGFEIMYKEERKIKRKIDGTDYTSAYIDYILMKK